MKTPKIVKLFETTSGETVKTLEEWKESELKSLFSGETVQSMVKAAIKHTDTLIEILSVKDKGRPLNRKDSKPRKPRVVADETKVA